MNIAEFLISSANAQEVAQEVTNAAAKGQEFSITSLVPLIAIFVVFYFLIIRPQSKKIKEHQEMVNQLKVGNKVVTSGGIVGTVRAVFAKENQVEIEISPNVLVKIVKSHVIEVVKEEKNK